jgi:hypothetical protein
MKAVPFDADGMAGADSSNACARHAKVRLRHGWKCPDKHNPQYDEEPCGSELAREEAVSVNISAG